MLPELAAANATALARAERGTASTGGGGGGELAAAATAAAFAAAAAFELEAGIVIPGSIA